MWLQFRPQAIIPAIQRKLLPMLLANYALWPLAHIINFKFVPVQQRILYINAVQVWTLGHGQDPLHEIGPVGPDYWLMDIACWLCA